MEDRTLAARAPDLLPTQARVFEAVAGGRMLAGPILDLARQFDATPSTFTDCLGGLVDAGWVTVTTGPESIVTIQLDQDCRARA